MSISIFSLANGGTSEIMAPADCDRTSLMIQPITENIVVNFGATSGTKATGTLTFGANATDGETIAINGVTVTAVTSVVSPTVQFLIGATKEDSAAALAAVLNASVNASLSVATYSNAAGTAIVGISFDLGGTDGNAFTLANSSGGHITRSAATLTGGLNTGGGLLLTAGQVLNFSAEETPDIKGAIYVVSPTNGAETAFNTGTWSTGR